MAWLDEPRAAAARPRLKDGKASEESFQSSARMMTTKLSLKPGFILSSGSSEGTSLRQVKSVRSGTGTHTIGIMKSLARLWEPLHAAEYSAPVRSSWL